MIEELPRDELARQEDLLHYRNPTLPVNVRVANLLRRMTRDEEVAQMYVHDLVSSAAQPVKELKGFRRISLKPGESTTVSLHGGPGQFAFTNIDKEYVVKPDDFEQVPGTSSRDKDLVNILLHVVQTQTPEIRAIPT